MASPETSSAEFRANEQLHNDIKRDIESSEIYQTISDELRKKVDEHIDAFIERKIAQNQKEDISVEDSREKITQELLTALTEESIHQEIMNERLSDMIDAIEQSEAFIELNDIDPDLQERVRTHMQRKFSSSVRSILKKRLTAGIDTEADSIVSEVIAINIKQLEEDVKREKLVKKHSWRIRQQIEENEKFNELTKELQSTVLSSIDTAIAREIISCAKKDVPENEIEEIIVKKLLKIIEVHSKSHSSIDRIVGKATDEEKQRELQIKKELFWMHENVVDASAERDKTEKEVELLQHANEVTNKVLQSMGLEPFDVPLENIHIIKKDKWSENKEWVGRHSIQDQNILIKEAPSLSIFFRVAVHELLHMKSYNAIQKTTEDKPKFRTYRLGLRAISRDGKQSYLNLLNEAVTEELTKMICEAEFEHISVLQEEIERTKDIEKNHPNAKNGKGKPLFTDDTYNAYYVTKNIFYKKFNVERYAYPIERSCLKILINKIAEKSGKKKEDIFSLFVESMMKGYLVGVTRLIEDTFGKGTFRKIAEIKDNEELLKFVLSLNVI